MDAPTFRSSKSPTYRNAKGGDSPMFSTQGRYSVQFWHRNGGAWQRHQFLNTDDRRAADLGFAESVDAVTRLADRSDVISIRLFDNEKSDTLAIWKAANQ